MKLTIGQKYYDISGDDMVAIDLKKVYTKESYNRKDSWGPANWVCGDHDDIGRAVYLKPSTIVLTGFCY